MGAIKNRRFQVYKIPVEELLKQAVVAGRDPVTQKWEFSIRLTGEEMCRDEWQQAKADCVLCTQLLKTKVEKGIDDEEIWQDLVMMNWEEASSLRKKYSYIYWPQKDKLVSIANEELLFWLFSKGFEAEHDGRWIRYVRFERSANMSRNGVMSYINESWKADLLERVTLGLCRDNSLDWLPGGISLSKWEAYKGLALSDAHDMAGTGFDIRRVAVIPDKEARTGTFPMGGYYTGEESGEQKAGTCRYQLVFRETDKKANINYFDGQGVVDPALARAWEEKLYPSETERGRRSSFQIRMPFVKGVVHSVDFRAFLKEHGVDTIVDLFGKEHRIEDLDMILTKSQFKSFPWFKDLFGEDAWTMYQERFEKYEHSLFVTKANTLADEKQGTDFLNYQVIQSLGLTVEEFEALAQGSVDELARIKNDALFGYRYIRSLENPAEDVTDAGYGAMARALKKDPTLLLTARFRAELEHYEEMRKKDIQGGRLETKGSVRIFAGDLMMFLNHLLGQRKDKTLEVSYADALPIDAFYAPAFTGESDVKYGIFRNPHMARNEHAYMRHFVPKEGSERARFLGHLEGVLMVNPESMAAERMAGADYDGDLVNVVDDEVYSRALDRRTEKEDLALIVIPSPGTVTVDKTTKHLEKQEYRLLQNQIGSLVGQYSYMAFCKAADAYGYLAQSEEPEAKALAAKAGERIRDFTVKVGLEIDSVKSGRKPVISDELWVSGNDYEPFLKSEKEEDYETVPEYREWIQYLLEEGYEEFLARHTGEIKCNMNLLPLYVNRVAVERHKIDGEAYFRVPSLYAHLKDHFDTEVFVDGSSILATSKGALWAMNGLRRAWSSYRQEKSRKKRYEKFAVKTTAEQKKVKDKILAILFLQYEPEEAFLAMDQIEEFFSHTYFGCLGRKALWAAIKAARGSRFKFALKQAQRRMILWEILQPLQPRMKEGEEKERFEALFTNFSERGAGLLELAMEFAAKDPNLSKPGEAAGEPEEKAAWQEDLSEESYQLHLEQGDDVWIQAYYKAVLPHPSSRRYLACVKEEALKICERFHPGLDREALEKMRMNYCLKLSTDSSRKFLWAVCGAELERYVKGCIIPGMNDEEEGETEL